jgi:hypothetical protein
MRSTADDMTDDEIMAFPLVARGETVASTIDLFAEACNLT